jgi:hypothetical protein
MTHLPSSSIESNKGTSMNSIPLLGLSIGKKISIKVSKCWGTLLQGTYLPEGEILLDKIRYGAL